MEGRPIDHVALVVEDLEEAERLFRSLGFDVRYRERIDDQEVDVLGMRAGDATIELLKPLREDSPIERFRGDKRSRLHHLAYRVADIEAELARVKALGMELIDERPRRGAHGNRIAFIRPSATGGVLIEICQPGRE